MNVLPVNGRFLTSKFAIPGYPAGTHSSPPGFLLQVSVRLLITEYRGTRGVGAFLS